jgi:hypothetical protein
MLADQQLHGEVSAHALAVARRQPLEQLLDLLVRRFGYRSRA